MERKERERLIAVIYNGTVIIFDICLVLRKANYSKEAAKHLAFNLFCLNNNLMLKQSVILSEEKASKDKSQKLNESKVKDFYCINS